MPRKPSIATLFRTLEGKGFTQKEIRDLTGIPERTQRRWKKENFTIDRPIERNRAKIEPKLKFRPRIARAKTKEKIEDFFRRIIPERIFDKTTQDGLKEFTYIEFDEKPPKDVIAENMKKLIADDWRFVYFQAELKTKRKGAKRFKDQRVGTKAASIELWRTGLGNLNSLITSIVSKYNITEWSITQFVIVGMRLT